MATSSLLLLVSIAALILTPATSHNITAILDGFPEYSLFNSYLSQTKVCDEINSRETITCLALPNSAMSSLAAKHTLAGIKNAIRLLVLLDYFDSAKLHDLPRGTTLVTTLYQTTGNAEGNSGFVNITNVRGGKVAFGPAVNGSKLVADYTKSVKQIPYNISILEISAPITFAGLLDAPATATANITALLEKAGCKTFASLVESSGVMKMFEAAEDKGLTLFAPNDEAFKAERAPDLSKLSSAELVTLLQYHALPSYTPKASLESAGYPIATMATNGAGKFQLSVTSHGDDVSLDTGVDTSRIAETLLDDTPVCILTVDNILLPSELFGAAPAPAPGPVSLIPAPAPAVIAPAPSPKKARHHAKAPSPVHFSPPAPPMGSPVGSPAMSPEADSQKEDDKSAAMASALRPLEFIVAVICFATLL